MEKKAYQNFWNGFAFQKKEAVLYFESVQIKVGP